MTERMEQSGWSTGCCSPVPPSCSQKRAAPDISLNVQSWGIMTSYNIMCRRVLLSFLKQPPQTDTCSTATLQPQDHFLIPFYSQPLYLLKALSFSLFHILPQPQPPLPYPVPFPTTAPVPIPRSSLCSISFPSPCSISCSFPPLQRLAFSQLRSMLHSMSCCIKRSHLKLRL